MKRISLSILILVFISCSPKEHFGDIQEIEPFVENTPFSFEKVAEPSVWATFASLKEMQKACQMPDVWLKNISTENLVETCMNYPLIGTYMAYNNELMGIKVVMDGFNGFQELKKREDGLEKLLDYYEQFELKKAKTKSQETEHDIVGLGYLELILASGEISSANSSILNKRAKKLMRNKYSMKLNNKNVYSIYSVKKSLILGARLELDERRVTGLDSLMLYDFVKSGGNIDNPEVYNKISNIISK